MWFLRAKRGYNSVPTELSNVPRDTMASHVPPRVAKRLGTVALVAPPLTDSPGSCGIVRCQASCAAPEGQLYPYPYSYP